MHIEFILKLLIYPLVHHYIIISIVYECYLHNFIFVATLALGSWPKQGLARLRAKKEAWESHHMLPKVQRVWGNEPSHSHVNSHCGNWSLKWTPDFLECDYRGQNPLVWRVFYIIGNLLKRRCLKWACMTHLDM
jgi:hypothetical protein